MDQVSDEDTSSEVARARRRRMRATARGQHVASPRSDEYETPQWLDRSFVLPLSPPEVTGVPSQAVPHHDDYEAGLVDPPATERETDPAPQFVRPASPEVDFAKVIRRADLSRSATRTALIATGVAGLVLIAYLLTSSPVVLGMTISFGLVALVAIALRVRLATAAIPHLDR